MIFIMSMKQWEKNKKKLVQYKDYIIFDGTDDDDAKLSKFTNTVTMDAFCPPARLLKLTSDKAFDSSEIIDLDKIEDLEDRYLNGVSMTNAILATVSGLCERDINMFIVLRNKAFKTYKKRLRRRFITMFNVNIPFVYILDDTKECKKALRESLSEDELNVLSERLHKLEKDAEKKYDKEKKRRKKIRK